MNAWQDILSHSDIVAKEAVIDGAIRQLARQLTDHYHDKNPIILCLMNGGLFFTAKLTQKLAFPIRLDYIHATRYRGQLSGSELQWVKSSQFNLANEHVLIFDDIFDEGITLKEVTAELTKQNPASIESVVLVDKLHQRKPDNFNVRYVGMHLKDLYLFGFGMDYLGHWRHLSEIYAVRSEFLNSNGGKIVEEQ